MPIMLTVHSFYLNRCEFVHADKLESIMKDYCEMNHHKPQIVAQFWLASVKSLLKKRINLE